MTFYEQQVKQLGAQFEQKEYLYTQLKEAKDFIHANFSQTITVRHIASAACISKFHFLRLFKNAYHCTPHEYLIGLRIRKAKLLLQDGCKTNDGCTAVGYSSPGTFKLLFKKHTSKTPAAYREYANKNAYYSRSLTVSPFFWHYKKAIFKPLNTIHNPQLYCELKKQVCE